MIDDLVRALRLDLEASPPSLALVGAGGKTTTLFSLGRRLLLPPYNYPTVLLTASTHLSGRLARQADAHFVIHSPREIEALAHQLPSGVVAVTGPPAAGHEQEIMEESRVTGLEPETLARLRDFATQRRLPLLIEADGSRLRPLKAPAAHEPALPSWVRQVGVIAGLSGLGKPLESSFIHRPERFAALSGLSAGETVTPAALARVLLHPEGGRKNIPVEARKAVLLNGAATSQRQAQGRYLAAQLLPAFDAVLVADLHADDGMQAPETQVFAVHEPAAAILLAAGGSRRLGHPKQLLEWRGQPLVRWAAQTALAAGLSPLIVVTGAYAAEVRLALENLPIETRHNPDWEAGQSTSLACGVKALPAETGSAVFMLSDQPYVTVELVRSLVELHAASLAPIVAPLVDGQRANPVLFDRRTFADLRQVTGDVGGRVLFARYKATWLPWHDASVLLDVDTPEDYARLQNLD